MLLTPLDKRADNLPLCANVRDQRCFFLDLRDSGSRRDFSLVYGGTEFCEPNYYLIRRDGFPFIVIELVAAGEGEVTLDGKMTRLRAGSVFVYGNRTRLEIRTSRKRPMRKSFLCFTGRNAPRRMKEAGIAVGTVRQLALFNEAQQIIDDLVREGCHERNATGRICSALSEVFLIKIQELGRWSESEDSGIEEEFLACCAMVDANFLEITSLAEIARRSGVSTTRICRLFRRYKGISPYQYLLRKKMTYAAESLLRTGCRVKEAAERVGFSDPYHFSRCFRAIHQLSPKKFQLSLGRGVGAK